MSQQINLCTPILLTQKRYFSANTMAVALGVFLFLGSILCGVWVWNLNHSGEALQRAMDARAGEVDSLQAAIKRARDNAAPVDPALQAQLAERRQAVQQRESLREALKEGVFRPGWGHSDRLTWVARSIPAPVWISEVRLEGTRFEVSGYTYEPAALNEWVNKLGQSPLMQNLKLSTVKVEKAAVPPSTSSSGTGTSGPTGAVWSFTLVSVEPAVTTPSASASAPGSRP